MAGPAARCPKLPVVGFALAVLHDLSVSETQPSVVLPMSNDLSQTRRSSPLVASRDSPAVPGGSVLLRGGSDDVKHCRSR